MQQESRSIAKPPCRILPSRGLVAALVDQLSSRARGDCCWLTRAGSICIHTLRGGTLLRRERRPEGFEQGAVDRAFLRIVFRMPLHSQRKARRVGDADRLDGAVLRHALDDNAGARLEDALTMERVDAYHLAAEDPREGTPRHKLHVVAVGEA